MRALIFSKLLCASSYCRQPFRRSQKLRTLGLARVREVRGQGLLVGLELKERVQPFLAALPAGPKVLRLPPPLVIEYEQLDRVVDAIGAALA